ncbi:MAG: hypothetical protein R6X22_06150 [Gemmatimonadota bacterium]
MESREDRARRLSDRALSDAGFADPRPLYRELLRRLRETDPEGFREAARHYETELVPAVAERNADPVEAWIGYGARIAARLGPGRVVRVDATGRALPLEAGPPPEGSLVLHLPDDGSRATVLLLPLEPSEPQGATVELLTG